MRETKDSLPNENIIATPDNLYKSKMDWTKLKDSKNLSDQYKALIIVSNNPKIAQRELVEWFLKSGNKDLKARILELLTQESKIELISKYKDCIRPNTLNILELIDETIDQALKAILIEYALNTRIINDDCNIDIIMFIKRYMELKKCGLKEARVFIEEYLILNKSKLVENKAE